MFLFNSSKVIMPFYIPINSVWEFQVPHFFANIRYDQLVILDIFIYQISP